MPSRIRFLFATLSLVFFFIAAAPLYRELSGRSDIWWTPHALLVPLVESKDRVEIYARGNPLQLCSRLASCRLRTKADQGPWQRAMSVSVSTTGTGCE
jgi:hypothetical protein